jgi:sigma-B regulation protein RsbU (phosphoserine phosphatase)
LFTIWYGVLDRSTRQLTFASGGHPPAILVAPDAVQRLGTGGRVIGCDPAAEFRSATCEVKPGCKLYVFSDGAYEIMRPEGTTLQLADLIEQLRKPGTPGQVKLNELVAWANGFRGNAPLEDDLSLMEIEL